MRVGSPQGIIAPRLLTHRVGELVQPVAESRDDNRVH